MCGSTRNLRDIKEQFLLCAAELTPQNTQPHDTDAVQTKSSQWKTGPPLRENTLTFPPRQHYSLENNCLRSRLVPLPPPEPLCCLFSGCSAALWLDLFILHTDPIFMKSHVKKIQRSGMLWNNAHNILCEVKLSYVLKKQYVCIFEVPKVVKMKFKGDVCLLFCLI